MVLIHQSKNSCAFARVNVAADSDGILMHGILEIILMLAIIQEKYMNILTQSAATMWYHDHAVGITRLNVYAVWLDFILLETFWKKDLIYKVFIAISLMALIMTVLNLSTILE